MDKRNTQYYFTYFVVFRSSGPNLNGPIVHYSGVDEPKFDNNGTMHLFDEDMDCTLGLV